ncbi:MAG TPA: DUF2115 domain-containing protein [Methanoregulaceae archaeon]|nr:DUF2115 domain-containing protein [Methanoregulaceae archaeon]
MDENDTRQRIKEAVRRMSAAGTKGDLGGVIARELLRFSLYDLQVMGGMIRREVDKLPQPYREKFRPYFQEQYFGYYHRCVAMYRSDTFARMHDAITDTELFGKFCAIVDEGSFANLDGSGTDVYFENPLYTLYYYLISGFAMFVLDEPGHPVGTPFPGGFEVEKRGSEYFCPIREKEEDVIFSICNVCPAKQLEGV